MGQDTLQGNQRRGNNVGGGGFSIYFCKGMPVYFECIFCAGIFQPKSGYRLQLFILKKCCKLIGCLGYSLHVERQHLKI